MLEARADSSAPGTPPDAELPGWARRLLRWSLTLLPIVAITVAVWVARGTLGEYSVRDIIALTFGFPAPVLAAALALTTLGYLMLAGYDWIALRHVGRRLSVGQVLLAGFTGFAISNNAGHALVSGGALRYRFYSGWGLGALEIAQVVLLSTITYFLAAGTLLTASFLFAPSGQFTDNHLAGGTLQFAVWASIATLAAYWVLVLSGRRTLRWREHVVQLPGPRITLFQSLVGTADLLLAAAVLYVLLRQHMDIGIGVYLNAYIIAQLLGLLSQSPGGIGVFEGAFLYLVSDNDPSGGVLAALVVYRAVYFLLPLVVASVLVLGFEVGESSILRRRLAAPWLALRQVLPWLFSALLLVCGAMLLLSGTVPGEIERLEWLGDVVPVPLIEASHLLGSLAGLMLLVLARGVRLRLRAAWVLTLQLLAIGTLASLLKGADYEEAAVLALMFLLLLPARPVFYRLSRVDQAGLTLPWAAGIAALLAVATVVGFLSYRNVEYAHSLWFSFALHGDASRFLRATLALALLAGGVLSWFVLRRSHYVPHAPDTRELGAAARLAATSRDSNNFLALTGDKHLFWNEARSGYIAYVTTARYWIAIGDPCGPPAVQDELVWQFREQADRYGAKPVFYRVRPEGLPMYLDLGLTLLKLGEEALVDLQTFDLAGGSKAAFRNRLNRLQREGWELRVLSPLELTAAMPRLEAVSQEWLAAKNTREKGISLGFFDPAYLQRTEVAVLAQGERIAAFANLWRPDEREEISVDLMRYGDDAPQGAMEFLLVSLMLWGKAEGYRHFNLGMAPLSGFEQHALAPLWHKLGSTIFRYGNEFYNFQGLREYKDKFDPAWSPRYLALPSVVDTPAALLQITTQIAGGVRGVFAR